MEENINNEIKDPETLWAYLKVDPSVKLRIQLPQANGIWKFNQLTDNKEIYYRISKIEVISDHIVAAKLEEEYLKKFYPDKLISL